MEMPNEFMKLVEDFDPQNLNLMKAEDVAILFKHVRDLATELEKYAVVEEYCDEDGCFNISNATDKVLQKFREWK